MTAPTPDQVAIGLPSDPKYLPLIRAVVEQGSDLCGFDATERGPILLAVTEALTNVIRHVYKGRRDERIDIVMRCVPEEFRLEITDYGRFVDPARISGRPLDEVRPGGLGVHLMRSTMDVVDYRENRHGGTTLTLVKHSHPGKERS
jgi:anti-sigma regulatory factor (Ser/Thr protein kinase)